MPFYKQSFWLPSLVIILFTSACAYNKKTENDAICLQQPPVTYVYVDSVLEVHGCKACHAGGAQSGGINLEGVDKVKLSGQSGRLTQVMRNKSMPPVGSGYESVPNEAIEKINRWICQGANP